MNSITFGITADHRLGFKAGSLFKQISTSSVYNGTVEIGDAPPGIFRELTMYNKYGIGHHSRVQEVKWEVPADDLKRKIRMITEMFGWAMPPPDAGFMTMTTAQHPVYVYSGKAAVCLDWGGNWVLVKRVTCCSTKPFTRFWLNGRGNALMPVRMLVGAIRDDLARICDPLATKTSRRTNVPIHALKL